ncbi:DUF3224 domain-containing protein [Kitasatospora sp. NPDC002040]|uniref:DUF3224 domain-containing protein n=1 Tax=Kitasatospora sp. NPDC002040 TaxID=3154661 RepID=UPI003330DB2C
MRASGTFTVKSFVPAELTVDPVIETAIPVGVATLTKEFEGEIIGRSSTIFTGAYDQAAGVGTYLAMESFEGSLNGHFGAFNFVHSMTTTGGEPSDRFFLIVPASGTGKLTGITGGGGLKVEADGTHRIWFDYEIA